MSRGKKLQEMEVKTQQSKSAVNANAKPGDPMPKLTTSPSCSSCATRIAITSLGSLSATKTRPQLFY